MPTYTCFTRTWWKFEKDSTGNRIKSPHLGRKTILRTFYDRNQAVEFCEKYNASHNPGPLDRKAEFTSN